MQDGQIVTCPRCGDGYKFRNMLAADQSVCPDCRQEAEEDLADVRKRREMARKVRLHASTTPSAVEINAEEDRGTLVQWHIELCAEMDAIKEQIAEAKRRAAVEGLYGDPAWWRKVNAAQKHKGRACTIIQARLSVLKKREKAASRAKAEAENVRFGKVFMRLAKQTLPEATYLRLLEEAIACVEPERGSAPTSALAATAGEPKKKENKA